jgi:hypothetical protein
MLSRKLQLASVVFGFIGTLAIFLFSYSLIPYQGGVFGSEKINKHNNLVKKKNCLYLVIQKIGMGMLSISFLLQGIALFVQ